MTSRLHLLRRLLGGLLVPGWLAAGSPAAAGEVSVAVAANFAQPLARLAEGFKASTGHTLKISSGSTGKLYSQVVAGAPFEVLLSGDDETPARLAAEGHALAATRFTYATGRLVLWSATPGLVDAQGAVLAGTSFRYLAIANPRTAPYGRAAMEVLRARGLADVLEPRLVTGESIAQTYQFVLTGNAELGLVALSQVRVPGRQTSGSLWLVPTTLHREIRQDAVLLRTGENHAAARALLDYLKSEPARALIRTYGYGP